MLRIAPRFLALIYNAAMAAGVNPRPTAAPYAQDDTMGRRLAPAAVDALLRLVLGIKSPLFPAVHLAA